MKKHFAAGLALIVVLTISGNAVAQPTLTSGTDATATLTGAVRLRNLSNQSTGAKELWIGVPPLSESGVLGGDLAGGWVSSQCVEFSVAGSTLKVRVAVLATPCNFSSSTQISRTIAGPVDYLHISLQRHSRSQNFTLANLAVNGTAVTPGSLTTSGEALTSWKLGGVNLSGGFAVTGVLQLQGLGGGVESNIVEVVVGTLPASDTEGPETTSVSVTPDPVLLNGTATVRAQVSDADRGGNNIYSAEYSVDEGPWTAMDSQDGTFNSPTELVEASFTMGEVGTHEVCVRGTDSLSNAGDPACQTFYVAYQFTGFFSPVDNSLANIAKAGQAVPVKWRLTDANGDPISNTDSFAGLYTRQVNCTALQEIGSDVLEEYAGGSGLQYNGDGYWQFNWKTPKQYAGTCQAMFVAFRGGQESPVVRFQFTK